MNKVILMGRLTRDPDVRYQNGDTQLGIARYTLAVDRKVRRDNNDPNAQTADFISCISFGRGAQFAEQYLHKGTKLVVTGRIQTGKYTNKDGQTVYTTDVVVEDQEFAESKQVAAQNGVQTGATQNNAPQQNYAAQNYQSQPNRQQAQRQTQNQAANPSQQYVQQTMQNMQQQTAEGFIDIPEGIDEDLPFR